MPSDLQLHPVKLKCKLEYKSHYLYDMIYRDHVISAITWLKAHNSHYTDIKLNEHWYSDIAAGELSLQLDESDNLLCKAVWLTKLFSLIVNMSRGKFTVCMWVYCNTQLLVFRFSFLHNT